MFRFMASVLKLKQIQTPLTLVRPHDHSRKFIIEVRLAKYGKGLTTLAALVS